MHSGTPLTSKAKSNMVDRSHQHGTGSFADLARDAQRVADRFTWLRLFVFTAMVIRLSRAYVLTGDLDGATYIALWFAAVIGCWTASGWLLDLPRLILPGVSAFQHLRRPAPRA